MQEPRIILAAVLKDDDEIDMVKLGRIAQDKRCGRTLSPEDTAIWTYLAENEGAYCLASAARQYTDHLKEQTRRNGGTIVTTTTRNGRTTTARRTYPTPKTAHATSRPRSCSRTARPRERRASASSSTSSADPGSDSDPPPPAPVIPALAPRGAAHRVALSWLAAGSMLLQREEARR